MPSQSGEFCFEHDVDEILILVNLAPAGLTGTQAFYVVIEGARIYDRSTIKFQVVNSGKGTVQTSPVTIPSIPVNGVSRYWNQPVKRSAPSGWTRCSLMTS